MVVTRTELTQIVDQVNKKFDELEAKIKENNGDAHFRASYGSVAIHDTSVFSKTIDDAASGLTKYSFSFEATQTGNINIHFMLSDNGSSSTVKVHKVEAYELIGWGFTKNRCIMYAKDLV